MGFFKTFTVKLVAKEFKQKEGKYDFDTYTAVARITSIKVFMALASIFYLYI